MTDPVSNLVRRLGARLSSSEIKRMTRQGDAARNARDWTEALACYKAVVEADPSRSDIMIQMGHAAKELRQFDAAAAAYQQALLQRKADDDLLIQIGHLEKVRGNPEGATGWYERALALNPLNEDAKREVAQSRPRQSEGGARPFGPDVDYLALGNRERDLQQWPEAVLAYEAHLAAHPGDVEIWGQLGNCRKEAGDLVGAEAAHRQGLRLAPRDPNLHLQLGRLLELDGRHKAAVEAYATAFRGFPSREVAALLTTAGGVPDYDLVAPSGRVTTTFVDISDLLRVMLLFPTVSGIQRVQYGLLAHALEEGDPGRRFVTWFQGRLWTLQEGDLAAIVREYEGVQAGDRRGLIERAENNAVLACPGRGDTFVTAGVIYFRPDIIAENWRLKRAGVRLGGLVYDYIPLTTPEYVGKAGALEFSTAMSEALFMLDFVLCISAHVARETARLLADGGYPAIPIEVVPLAHSFTMVAPEEESQSDTGWTVDILALQGQEFVLCVGSAFQHKNHMLLLQAWKILLGSDVRTPLLVLAGKHGAKHSDLHQQLDASEALRRHVVIVDGPSDEELAVLYRHCLFTMLPSFVEGWGLPVGESLAYGKVCFASNTSSVPEVGGDLVMYFDPFNARDCAGLIARFLRDRGELAALEERIRREFKPRLWSEVGQIFFGAIAGMPAAAPIETSARRGLLALPADTMQRTRRFSREEWPWGTALPPAEALAESVRPRAMLDHGWYTAESWGVWMHGQAAALDFLVEAPAGSAVRVVLVFRSAPWASGNSVTAVSSGCRAVRATPPPSVWPERAWQSFQMIVPALVGADGRVKIELRLGGGLVTPWWDTVRRYAVGLTMLFWSPDALPAAVPVCRFVSCGKADRGWHRPLPGKASFKAQLEAQAILSDGWRTPEDWGCWMDGETASARIPTGLAAGAAVRVALVLRGAASARSMATIDGGGEAVAVSIPEYTGRDLSVWVAGVVGADGAVVVRFDVVAVAGSSSGSASSRGEGRLGIVGFAYGEGQSVTDRLALAESLLFLDQGSASGSAETAVDGMCFTIVGHMKGSYSLAAVNRALATSLEAAYPGRVRIEQVENGVVRDLGGIQPSERGMIEQLVDRRGHVDGPEVVIAQHWPVWVPQNQGDLLLAWMAWEESHVPADVVETLNRNFDGVLVQSRSVAKSMIDSGVRLPVRLMGCAPRLSEVLAVGDRREGRTVARRGTREAPFTILHVSSCFPRKGADLLLEAYVRTFTRHDPVKLVIKTFPNVHNDIPQAVQRLQRANPELPAIEVINQDLSTTAVTRLYESADAVVLPTRGEGFNLPAAEALAAGVPLIVTGYGAQLDYAGPEVARQLDFEFAYSKSHLGSSSSVWADPDLGDLQAALSEAFGAHAEPAAAAAVAEQVRRGRAVARELARGDIWAAAVTQASTDILRQKPSQAPAVAWVSTWSIRCGIAEYSRVLLEHYPDPHNRLVVLHDERTLSEPEYSETGRFRPSSAWRVYDSASMDGLAQAIETSGAPVVVIQHHKGLIRWHDLVSLLQDPRVRRRQVVVELHNVQEFPEGVEAAPVIEALGGVARVLVHAVNDLNLMKQRGLLENVALFPLGVLARGQAAPSVRELPPSSAPLIGAYGFFLPHKGFGELIRAFATLRQTWPRATLRLVTAKFPNYESQEELARCETLAESLGLQEDAIEWNTDYLPNDESLALLHECDLVVLPYQETPESASSASRNALASRAPVAVTPILIFDDAQDAVLRMGGTDAEAIAESLAVYLRDRELRAQTVAAAGRWLDVHDWGLAGKRLEGMLTSLTANPLQ